MAIFRKTKRETPAGKGKEDTTAFRKIFDVLNYTPVRYGFLKSWLVFMDSAEDIFRKKLSQVTIDSLNAGAETNGYVAAFDPYIEAMALPAYANGKEQYENQEMMCNLLVSYIKNAPGKASVLVLDDGNGERSFIPNMLKNLPAATEVNMLTNDAFSLTDIETNILFNRFPVRIFTQHESMESCKKIEHHCGDIDVVKRSSATAIDRRWKTNSAWDIMLGNNRTDTETICAPTRDPRFRKEYIQALPPCTGIIDAGGDKVIFSF